MKILMAMAAVMAMIGVGCGSNNIVLVELDPCLSCSDAIIGAEITKENACEGSFDLWQTYKLKTCGEASLCKVYCEKSLCDGKMPSSDCKDCAKFGTIFNEKKDPDFFTCSFDNK